MSDETNKINQINQINPLLLRLARDTSHKGVTVECPELRISPTLPPQAAMSAAKSFADLDSVSEKFGKLRENHTSVMHTMVEDQARGIHRGTAKNKRTKNVVPQVGVASAIASAIASASVSAIASPPEESQACALFRTHTFLRCILEITDPSFRILSLEDSAKCLSMFLHRAESLLTRDRHGIATSYVSLAKNRGVVVSVQDVVESLRDPNAALSDEGLHDAAVVMMAQILRVTLVMRTTAGFISFYPNPSNHYSSTDHAVLIGWNESEKEYAIEDSGGPTIGDIRSRIFESSPDLLRILKDPSKLKRMSADELRSIATRAVVNVAKSHFATKAKIVEEIMRLEA